MIFNKEDIKQIDWFSWGHEEVEALVRSNWFLSIIDELNKKLERFSFKELKGFISDTQNQTQEVSVRLSALGEITKNETVEIIKTVTDILIKYGFEKVYTNSCFNEEQDITLIEIDFLPDYQCYILAGVEAP